MLSEITLKADIFVDILHQMVGPQVSHHKSNIVRGGGTEDDEEVVSLNNGLKIMAVSTTSDTEASSDSLPSVVSADENTSDEETWLYSSPRPNAQCSEWLKKDLDDPALLTVRHSLLNKLDEIANSPRQTPTNTPHGTPRQTTPFDTPKHTPKHTPNDTPRETPDISMSSSSPNTSGLVTPDSPPSSRGEIDTRTFVRPRKKKSLPSGDAYEDRHPEKRYSDLYEGNKEHYAMASNNTRFGSYGNIANYDGNHHINYRMDGNLPSAHNAALRMQMHQKSSHGGSGGMLARSSGSLGSEDDDHLSSASEGSYCKIADVEDVNTLARLQEESLKIPDVNRHIRTQEESKLTSARSKMSRLPGPPPSMAFRNNSGRVSVGSSQEDLLSGRSGIPGQQHRWQGFSPPISPYTSNSSLNATNGGSNGLRLAGVRPNDAGSVIYDEGSSPGGSRGGSPARDLSATRRTRLPSPHVRGVVRSDRNRVGGTAAGGIPRPSSSNTASPLRRPSPTSVPRPSGLRPPASSNVATPSRAPRVTPTVGVPAPVPLKSHNDWREGCY